MRNTSEPRSDGLKTLYPRQKPSVKKPRVAKSKAKPESKQCAACGNEYPYAEYCSKSGASRYNKCRECRRVHAKEAMRRRRVFDHGLVRGAILTVAGGECVRCGYSEFSSSLEFHHVTGKEHSLSMLISKYCYGGTGSALEVLVSELGKCVVLCSNCHKALHHGGWVMNEATRSRRIVTSQGALMALLNGD